MQFPFRISIAALIYRSARFADAVYKSLHDHTPGLSDKIYEPAESGVRFFFVANDPEPNLLRHLQARGYPWILQRNRRQSEDELFRQGYGAPEYIARVYRGWNAAIMHGDEVCVLINSDHFVSPGWLPGLLNHLTEQRIVCSQVVERPGHVWGGSWEGSFGDSVASFDETAFLEFAASRRRQEIRPGGEFMPACFFRRQALECGLYPEGNLHAGRYNKIREYGDACFFRKMKERFGCEHVSSMESVVYHVHCGEMEERDP